MRENCGFWVANFLARTGSSGSLSSSRKSMTSLRSGYFCCSTAKPELCPVAGSAWSREPISIAVVSIVATWDSPSAIPTFGGGSHGLLVKSVGTCALTSRTIDYADTSNFTPEHFRPPMGVFMCGV